MQEDTKPEKDDIQDEEREKPFSRSEYHGVITSYAGLALSLIAIILSLVTMYQSHMMETREIVQILRAEDDGYYHFDGETLFKNFQVTVANNSAIPVSVAEVTIERDGEARTFRAEDLPDVLPLNIAVNHTEILTIPWEIPLSSSEKFLLNIFRIGDRQTHDDETHDDEEESRVEVELLTSSRRRQTWKDLKELLTEYYGNNLPELDELEISRQVSAILYFYGYAYDKEYKQKTLPLSVTLSTAKNNRYVLNTEDMGTLESSLNEGSWATQLFLSKPNSIWETSQDFSELNEEE